LHAGCRAAKTTPETPFRDGAQIRWQLSWEDAQEAAGQWLGSLRLGRDLTGKAIDLTREELPYTGKFRDMVLEAVRRKLKKRGAKDIMLPPPSA
jgi:hypothetical protein